MRNSLKDFYEEYWEYRKSVGKIHTEKNAYIPKRLKIALSMINDRESQSKINILDIGCGEGTLGMLLKEKSENYYTVGCDISEKSLELAEPYYDKTVLLNIDEDDPRSKIGSLKFDFIVCVEVIEHLLNPEIALEKCKELLSEEGFLITSFPNIAWWQYRIKLLKGHFPEESRFYHHAEHLHDFTLHSFTKLLNEAKLETVEIGGEFIPPGFMKNIKPRKLLEKIMRKYPNLFGYQLVMKTKVA